jgi:hypothetical protein
MKGKGLKEKHLRFEQLERRQLLSGVPGVHAAAIQSTTSSNWSGYAIATANGAVTAVSGSWKVPSVSGTSTGYAAEWVGIDGYSSSTVEQIGTESDSPSGSGSDYAWYEMYPSGSVTINTAKSTTTDKSVSATVDAGDSISASVTYIGNNEFGLTITDTTQDWTYTTDQSMGSSGRFGGSSAAERSSAEWIVEAPSSGFGILPLADFGSVSFAGASATIDGVTGPIDGGFPSAGASQVYLINIGSRSATDDTTSTLTDSETPSTSSFTVAYSAPTTTNPSPTPPSGHHRGWGGWGGGGYYATNDPSQAQDSSQIDSKSAVGARDAFFVALAEHGLI